MWLRIKSISAFWDKIMNSKSKELFSWKDTNKPINIFYYNNWYWKTTLFTFIKKSLIWEKIKDKFISVFIMKLIIDDKEYTINNSPTNGISVILNKKDITYEKFKKILEEKVLNKNEKLSVAWRNTQWEQKRNTLESLLRFNFFSDDEFKKFNQQSCTLINSDLDGDTKWILLNYILWEQFNKEKEYLFKTAYRYWAKQKIIWNTQTIWKTYKEYFVDDAQMQFIDDPEIEFNNLVKNKISIKDSLIKLEAILIKLEKLKNESNLYLDNSELVKKLITEEELNCLEKKKEFLNQYSIIKNRINDLIADYWDIIKWIPSNTRKSIELRKAALDYVNKNKLLVEDYYRNNKLLFNKYNNWFIKELTKWIFNFSNITLDNRELKLSIWWWSDERKWDWRLKTLRFLSLIGIILYKAQNKEARNLWIWFFDSPFYGVDINNSTKSINSISNFINKNRINTQLFIFATKEEINEVTDSFQTELSLNNNVYFHPYEEKDFLIS